MIKIDKGFGREIVVDVINDRGNVPLGFTVHDPVHIEYRKVGYGKFGVKILTSAPTEVLLKLDGKVAVDRRIEPGLTSITTADDGGPLMFTPDGFALPRVAERRTAPVEPAPTDGEPVAAAPEQPAAPEREYAPSQGLVIVELRMARVTPPNSPELPPDDYTPVLFQLNAPAEHLQALAESLSKVVAPEPGPEVSDLKDGENSAQRRYPVRICSVCSNH